MSAGHRSRTWLGVSCSSLQRGQNPPRHAGLRHCGHSGTGILPIRCRYWVEPAQWPALSWWTSTERKRSRPITGGGTVVPIRWRNQPWGRWLAVRVLAILATALCTVRVSTGTASCGRPDAALARASAFSLPWRPQWEGTHWRWIRRSPGSARLARASHTALFSCVRYSAGPLLSALRSAWESLQTTIGDVVCAWLSRRCPRASRRATSSAR